MIRQTLPKWRLSRGQGQASVSRRQVLKGALGAGLAWQLPLVQAMTQKPAGDWKAWANPRRAVYQDMPYVDFTGHGQGYTPPRGNAATRTYLASLNDQQRLTLHHFY